MIPFQRFSFSFSRSFFLSFSLNLISFVVAVLCLRRRHRHRRHLQHLLRRSHFAFRFGENKFPFGKSFSFWVGECVW